MCTLFLGITNPFSYDLKEYLGYDITKFRDSFRVLEVVLSRKGKANGLCPLFFNGSVNEYQELPRPDDKLSLEKVYRYLDEIRGVKRTKTFLMKIFRRDG